ncbi:hypothetical protein D3C85_293000 [compost metagenome]
MKLKTQISPNCYQRMMLHPEALTASAYYREGNKIKQPIQSFVVEDFLYCHVQCKNEKDSTYVKYYVAEGEPRKDGVAFHTVGKLWAF